MRLTLAIFLLMVASSAAAEPRTALPPQMPALKHVVRSSGMIFSGIVLLVQPSGSDAVQITFRVENAIRGVRRGQIVRINEWAGLWTSGERYLKGEHVMLFLYPRSKLGFTSPVGGTAGRYAINTAGQVLLPGPTNGTRPVPLKTFNSQIRRAVGE